VCDVPVSLLTSDAPVYHQKGQRPARLDQPAADFEPEIADLHDTWLRLLNQPTIASKKSIYRRYDAQVKTNTVVTPGSDAGVIRVRGTKSALAATTDSNGRYLYLDPERGGALIVAEAARNLVASGTEPIGITDCLNYGDPTKPEIFYELEESAHGITAACKALNTPVISGNVSLYNETNGVAIYPTPMIGMVGLTENLHTITTLDFKRPGDLVYLLGRTGADFNGTELQKLLTGDIAGRLFDFDLDEEVAVQKLALNAIRSGLVTAAHDLSVGGFAAALSEMALTGQLGADLQWNVPASYAFAESAGRFLMTVPAAKQAEFEALLGARASLLGKVTAADQLHIQMQNADVALTMAELTQAYEEGIPCRMK
jgi:phosphoribosylformylglycinamidine synthase